MKSYDHKEIEKKWQEIWEKEQTFKALDHLSKPKYYALVEFPYPSGEGLHVGHPRPYIGMDLIARKRRAEGFNVLYPMGWDAFGLPAENYAIKTGIQPAITTKKNIDTFRKQMQSLGLSFDWSREINTTDPKYYKWTQWIFLQFLKAGLAYKAKAVINWCPKDKIGLANEEVVNGCCERCGTPVEKKEKEQWMLAITKYAERLDKDLDTVDYLPQIKAQQRNWIGRSEGVEIEFEIQPVPTLSLPEGEGGYGYHTGDAKAWKALQDRAVEMRNAPTKAEESLWNILKNNSTGSHFRRQHVIDRFIADFVCLENRMIIEADGDIHDLQKDQDLERTKILREKGFRVIRFSNEEILQNSDTVLEAIKRELNALPFGEGKGGDASSVRVFTTKPETIFGATFLALSGRLAKNIFGKDFGIEEETDRESKEKIGIDTGHTAINPANGTSIPIWVVNYVSADYVTGAIMGVPADDERDREFAKKYNLPMVTDYKKAGFEDFGKKVTRFKLRDWVFSRQRYWGEPIPVIHCEKCGYVAVPDDQLPVTLPEVERYEPSDNGESPLASIESWVNTTCPHCGGPAKRETDTMPNWAGSSWYYLRYVSPDDDKAFIDQEKLAYWSGISPKKQQATSNKLSAGPVDWYNGGMEHTTLHLLYSRFWHKFLFDQGLVPTSEPYMKRTSHGLILAEGGVKMSKSKGNVVNPDEILELYGADTLRVYEMFMGPFGESVAWSTESIIGPRRFLERVWKLAERITNDESGISKEDRAALETSLHQTIQKVSADIESLSFNTAVSALMIFVNVCDRYSSISYSIFADLLKLLAPFAPHITEEIWSGLGNTDSIQKAEWPKADVSKLVSDVAKITIQINGKMRSTLSMTLDSKEEAVIAEVQKLPEMANWLTHKTTVKVIYVKNRLINFVLSD